VGRAVILSNGHILVGLDEHGTVHDFYYPYVGLENLTSARNPNHKIGVWVDGKFSWLDDDSWEIKLDFEDEALVSQISASNSQLGVRLDFSDFVDVHYPAFCRIIKVTNTSAKTAEIRLFCHQAFQISRGGRSDTALYVPEGHYILDYKGWSSLLIYGQTDQNEPFDQFAVGNWGIEGKEGTFRDAEDGELSGSLVEHGGVDSVIRLKLELDPGQNKEANYWVIASDSQFDAEAIHHVLKSKGLTPRLESARQMWSDWMQTAQPKLDKIDPKYQALAKKSLLLVKAHTDKHGGIIASSDSSIYNYGRDYYCYVWPRDGAYSVLPLIELGYSQEVKKFLEFCADTMHPSGYMMHKYQPDRAVGSTWHPQLHKNYPELPIQEDETAGVIYAYGRYLEGSGDIDFVAANYRHFIKPAADFIAGFIDGGSGLPHPSYDLWEERFATHSYSVFITVAALKTASKIASRLNNEQDSSRWSDSASRIEQALPKLYNESKSYYRKSVLYNRDGSFDYDDTLDVSSAYGGLLYLDNPLENQAVLASFKAVEDVLAKSAPVGGVPRYEHDNYFLTKDQYLGNPWLITTLWLAQYHILKGDKQKAVELIDWVANRATASGMLAEQVDPETGIGVGVSPLVWSHSTFLETVLLLAEN
jgi:GH15 family glucan-1,4-alpha-glucosidase